MQNRSRLLTRNSAFAYRYWLALTFALSISACSPDATGGFTDGGDRASDAADGAPILDVATDSATATDITSAADTATATDTSTSADTATATDTTATDTTGPDTSPDTTADSEATSDTSDTSDTPTTFGAISGTVWAPGNAPGMVPADQEIPIYGAVVYLLPDRPNPIPQSAYCEACGGAPPRAVYTDPHGAFSLVDRVAGDWWLVIQKGQFRIEQRITIDAHTTTALPASATTLPSQHDPDNGRWIPRIAIATGSFDHLEDILGKLGLGAVDASGAYDAPNALGNVDIWRNGGRDFPPTTGDLSELVRDVTALSRYHIVFIPCSGSENSDMLRDPTVLNNLREYVRRGGNLYVTDWSGEWSDNVFPAAVQLGGFLTDTPASAYNFASNTWNTFAFGSADGDAYDSDDGEAVDQGLNRWLMGQVGPTATDPTPSVFDANRFHVEGNWNTIDATPQYRVGTDPNGGAVMDQAKVYVSGSGSDDLFGSATKKPLTVTFEPVGCGRVVYSTYHTTDSTHVGLTPQERVLVYLIMEIGTCRFSKG